MRECEKELISLSFKGGSIAYKAIKRHFIALNKIKTMSQYNSHWDCYKSKILQMSDVELRRQILAKTIEVDYHYWKKLKDC